MYVCINFNIVLLAIGTHKGEQLNVQRWPLPSTYVSDFNLGSAWMNDGAWLCSLIFLKEPDYSMTQTSFIKQS